MPYFNVAAHIKLVPHFQDKDLEAYFAMFEHNAQSLGWPDDKWTLLLSTSLKGKAQVAYANMETADRCDYERVKAAILKAYELVPEAYRQNFRTQKKSDDQTWVEYLKDKERLFDRWARSRNVETVSDMKNLILLEEFRNHVPKAIKIHLDDQEIVDARQAARKADDYTVVHKIHNEPVVSNGQSNRNGAYKARKSQAGDIHVQNGDAGSRGSSQGNQHGLKDGHNSKGETWCDLHKSRTHNTTQCRMLASARSYFADTVHPVTQVSSKTPSVQKGGLQHRSRDSPKSSVSLVMTRPLTDPKCLKLVNPPNGREVNHDSEFSDMQESGFSLNVSSLSGNSSTEVAKGDSERPVGQVAQPGSGAKAEVDPRLQSFVSVGVVAPPSGDSQSLIDTLSSDGVQVSILRDTGCTQSLMLKGTVPISQERFTGHYVIISGISGHTMSVPLYRVLLKSKHLKPEVQCVLIGVSDQLPVPGVDVLLGNDLALGVCTTEPLVCESPSQDPEAQVESDNQDCFPACVVTRAMQHKLETRRDGELWVTEGSRSESGSVKPLASCIDLSDTFMHRLFNADHSNTPQARANTCASVIEAQHEDPEIAAFFSEVLDSGEADKVAVCYVERDGLLMRKWHCPLPRRDDLGAILYQVVVPRTMRSSVLELAHDNLMAGYLGVRKTEARILEHFWWPRIARDVAEYVRTCHVCQVVGKPNQKPPVAPLRPIKVYDEPFTEVLLDVVGPLSRTSKGSWIHSHYYGHMHSIYWGGPVKTLHCSSSHGRLTPVLYPVQDCTRV